MIYVRSTCWFLFLFSQYWTHVKRSNSGFWNKKEDEGENEAFENWICISSRVQSEVQSEVQKVVQSYCLGWHFQTCYQKIVGKRFFYNIWTQEGQKYHIIWYKLVLKCCCCRRYCCWHCCSCSFSCCCRCQNRCAHVAVVVVVVLVVSSLPFWNQFVSNMWYFCLHCIQILKKNHVSTIFWHHLLKCEMRKSLWT